MAWLGGGGWLLVIFAAEVLSSYNTVHICRDHLSGEILIWRILGGFLLGGYVRSYHPGLVASRALGFRWKKYKHLPLDRSIKCVNASNRSFEDTGMTRLK